MMLRSQRILAGAGVLLFGSAGMLAQSQSTTELDKISPPTPAVVQSLPNSASASVSPLQPLLDFQDSDIKFNLATLMSTLRDNRHEGWVLAAYPDPKTSRPLIGAGFSLDLPAREHVQRDPLNPNRFLEPSSEQLWQAAGLDPLRLQAMLEQFNRNLNAWKKKRFRRKIRTHSLFPEISEEDATKLLRISAIQAVHNAKAYCRYFDQLNGPQQLALTQLVFQMGVNLEQFTQFLAAINNPSPQAGEGVAAGSLVNVSAFSTTQAAPNDYWHSVQDSLIHSDWARRYRTRAVSVIAMFDPAYEVSPREAEARVNAVLHPPHRRRRNAATVRTASASRKRASARRARKS